MDYTGILILACIFIPLERLLPLHHDQPILRRDWANDLFYLLFNGLVVRGGTLLVFAAAMFAWRQWWPTDTLGLAGQLPIWAQVIGTIVVADIGYYTAHRMAHAIPFLWRFHAVHHSIEEMDWLASHRVHPFDQIFTNAMSLLPVYFLGFSLEAVAIFTVIYQAQALLIHSNVRISFGPLKWLIASPEYHHWHHADQREAYNRNFAAQLSLIDVIAGTIFLPRGRRPDQYGVSDPVPRFYPQQFLYPFAAALKAFRRQRTEKATQMNRSLEDRIGMGLLLLVFGWLLYSSFNRMGMIIAARDTVPMWELILVAGLSNLIFLGLIVWFTATRLPARNATVGVLTKLVAIAGTFVMMLVAFTSPVDVGPVQRVVSTVLIVAGTILSILCLSRLGRSFAVVPAARALVTTGPYRVVRHPLYAAELIAVLGGTMSNGSYAAYAVGLSCLMFQIARARLEEKVLRESFPEYAAYAQQVPMLIPGLNLLMPRRPTQVVTEGV